MERLYKGLDIIKNYFHTSNQQRQKLMPELQQALFAIGSNIYQQAGGDAGAAGTEPPSGGSAPSGDDVIDADFTESK